ncbi:uncharacterized protein LOC124127526 [Haliotis rufescens]|uniref:uncharacterized protein LOC124127526 n=1 Tax=Haliotis rufescens TaxID=6454 RepID=UPI00201E9F00|nr:uncharacterized protein LOC124127526 [Haliotis rufescens]
MSGHLFPAGLLGGVGKGLPVNGCFVEATISTLLSPATGNCQCFLKWRLIYIKQLGLNPTWKSKDRMQVIPIRWPHLGINGFKSSTKVYPNNNETVYLTKPTHLSQTLLSPISTPSHAATQTSPKPLPKSQTFSSSSNPQPSTSVTNSQPRTPTLETTTDTTSQKRSSNRSKK